MVIISREQALVALKELFPVFRSSVHGAWGLYQKKVAGAFKLPTARTRANVVHDLIVEQLEARIRGMRGVRLSRSGDRALLSVGSNIVVEVHKLDADLVAMRNQTGFAEILDCQQLSNGLGPVAVLTLGYTHDDLGASLRDVMVVYTLNGGMEWVIDLHKDVDTTVEQHPESADAAKPKKGRVKAKPGVQVVKKNTDDGENKS